MAEAYRDGELMLSRRELNKQLTRDGAIARLQMSAVMRPVLDPNGVSHAVLVQPSFLGMDNHYLLDALRRYPRFRGIAVVQPTIRSMSCERLMRLEWSASGST